MSPPPTTPPPTVVPLPVRPRTLSWGIAATGRIARDVGTVLAQHPQMHLAAVGSRDLARAEALAAELGAARGHGSYRDLVADPQVQAVYVATPHGVHAPVVELALRAGKAVLCEKPLTHRLAESERLVALARETGTFLMEGMWMRFNPLVRQLHALVRHGGLGQVRSLTASIGFPAPYDSAARLWDPELGGGALLDLGVYVVDFARLLLGEPDGLLVGGSLAPTGVDAEARMLLSWDAGAQAALDVSLLRRLPGTATVVGSLGTAELGPSFYAPTELVLSDGVASVDGHHGGPARFTLDDRRAGFVGELEEVARCVAAGRTESAVMPLAESLATMRVLGRARTLLDASAGAS